MIIFKIVFFQLRGLSVLFFLASELSVFQHYFVLKYWTTDEKTLKEVNAEIYNYCVNSSRNFKRGKCRDL
ncbi:hypothetical protein RIR_jg36877.t1 [Rhizophagus irregularis DAOM 181602=DAOM 197198]|nr:hypothetical protein RIR_jg36877.t1 [Rhizophagus irregularis DAOM 181602=DAOM 197198]